LGHWAYILSDDEEDETAELLRELEKIKRERAEQREQEVGTQSGEHRPGFGLLTRRCRSERRQKQSKISENMT